MHLAAIAQSAAVAKPPVYCPLSFSNIYLFIEQIPMGVNLYHLHYPDMLLFFGKNFKYRRSAPYCFAQYRAMSSDLTWIFVKHYFRIQTIVKEAGSVSLLMAVAVLKDAASQPMSPRTVFSYIFFYELFHYFPHHYGYKSNFPRLSSLQSFGITCRNLHQKFLASMFLQQY